MKVLPRKFYKHSTIEVARQLLGKKLVRRLDGKILSGIIVETEAYRSTDDPASHSYRGRTERNSVMFGEVGHAYVYFTYGNHYCLNIVAKEKDVPAGAVLIRAVEPVDGIALMQKFRRVDDMANLTSGPGKLTKSLNITKEQNGIDVTESDELCVTDGKDVSDSSIVSTSRIGISTALDKQWRFLIASNQFVSRKPKQLS